MQKIVQRCLALTLVVGALTLAGCSTQGQAQSSATSSASALPSPSAIASATPPAANFPRLDGKATVEMALKGGKVVMELDGTSAPITAGNFVDLANRGFYNGLLFHRVVREPQPFVVQGGDPKTKDAKVPQSEWGTGGFLDPATNQERRIPLEILPEQADKPVYGATFNEAGITKPPKLKHKRGAVAMARSQFPDSASSQFYVTLGDIDFLDGNYAVFGYVTEGMELIDKVQQGDRIESIKVTKGAENLKNVGGKP